MECDIDSANRRHSFAVTFQSHIVQNYIYLYYSDEGPGTKKKSYTALSLHLKEGVPIPKKLPHTGKALCGFLRSLSSSDLFKMRI